MASETYLGEFEQLLLLAILQCGDHAYTVPVAEMLKERGGRTITRGALHTTLDRLETKALVRSKLGEPLAARGGRPRRYYTVTPPGLQALRAARTAQTNLWKGLESIVGRR